MWCGNSAVDASAPLPALISMGASRPQIVERQSTAFACSTRSYQSARASMRSGVHSSLGATESVRLGVHAVC
jgi:hypothetical protein